MLLLTSFPLQWFDFQGADLEGAAARALLQHQHYLYYPIMAVARFNLYAQVKNIYESVL